MRTELLLCGGLLLASCATTGGGAPNPDAAAQFERLKSLEGEWIAVPGEGDAPPGSIVRYDVTSGGTALVETLFAGAPHEMVTVYYLDAGQLALVHYCMGNQPRMVAQPSRDPQIVRFDFAGGANVDLERGNHMHAAAFHFRDEAHFEAVWTHWSDGQPASDARFVLVRSWR